MITIEQVKNYLGITDNTYDGQIQFAMDLAVSLVSTYTGRKLAKDTYTDTYLDRLKPDGRGGYRVSLAEFPVESITSVSTGGTYKLQPEPGILILNVAEPPVIVYVAGYDPLPMDLTAVLLDMIAKQLAYMGVDTTTSQASTPVKSVTVGSLRVDYAITPDKASSSNAAPFLKNSLAQYEDILNYYRHPKIMAATP